MKTLKNVSFFLLGLTLVLTFACGGSSSSESQRGDRAAQTASVPPPPAGSGQGRTGLHWTVPEGWLSGEPSSQMRKAQYRIPGEAGDAECVVFYFGPGQGGDARANAERWAGQFTQPDGRASTEVMKTESLDVNGLNVMWVEVKGTYKASPMMGGSAEPNPGYMLFGAIASGPDANWFFKLTGPEATVEANRSAFDAMVRSLQIAE